MATNDKDKSLINEAQKDKAGDSAAQDHQEGPFTAGQMRALKMMTSIMGVMIIICVILLGIGLSRQSEKLAADTGPKTISLPEGARISSMAADGSEGVWLYLQSDGKEVIQYYKISGKAGPSLAIERD